MRRLHFTKFTGAGNDFVVIDNRRKLIPSPARLAKRLCDRRFGIGADGLILVELSTLADYRMMYFNADGSYGGMCGNGGRCVAKFAVQKRLATAEHTFEALGHIYCASVRRQNVALSMKDVVRAEFGKRIKDRSRTFLYHRLDTGSPHIVIPVEAGRLDKVAVEDIGRRLRNHRTFEPKGTNVNFVEYASPTSIHMRTYERGVEAETLACGTGSIACGIAASAVWGMIPPITVQTKSGRFLVVDFKIADNGFKEVRLSGPAEKIFEGTIDV